MNLRNKNNVIKRNERMSEMIKTSYNSAGKFKTEEFRERITESSGILDKIKNSSKYNDSLGWLDPSIWAGDKQVDRLLKLSEKIKLDAEVLVLIGVGGSNNAARAAIKALGGDGCVEVVYAGNNLSPDYYDRVIKSLKDKSVYINVIAKNFETLEPGLAFRIFRKYLKKRYGNDYTKRVIVTGTLNSPFHRIAEKHGFEFLTFPTDIGGRFSALSDVGLFPMVVAGLDIRSMINGALDLRSELLVNSHENTALKYAIIRNMLLDKGFALEMLSFFDPRLEYFAKWWIQLFAESEGKDGKGLYPVSSSYSEDLHSIGQYVQDGTRIIFETFIEIENKSSSLSTEADDIDDNFDYLNGKEVDSINRAAFNATVTAHSDSGIPNITISIPELNEYSIGQLFYFFEYSVYVSGKILGINPFDQPGVEAYKRLMFSQLGK